MGKRRNRCNFGGSNFITVRKNQLPPVSSIYDYEVETVSVSRSFDMSRLRQASSPLYDPVIRNRIINNIMMRRDGNRFLFRSSHSPFQGVNDIPFRFFIDNCDLPFNYVREGEEHIIYTDDHHNKKEQFVIPSGTGVKYLR